MTTTTTAAALRAVLEDALAHDDDLVIVGESVGNGGGLAGTTRGLRERFGPARVVEVPVADRAAVGFAVGLALGGRTVVVELSSTGRLPAVLEALAEACAIAAKGEFRVPLVLRVPYGDEAGERIDRPLGDLLAGVPGLTVACGADTATMTGLLRAALRRGGPTLLLEPRALYAERGEASDATPLAARVLRAGRHVTVAAWGGGVRAALAAADTLAGEGIEVEVIDLVTLAPLDRATLSAQVRATGRLVVAHPEDAALAERVLRLGLHEAFLYLEAPPAAAPSNVAAVARAARDSATY